MSPVKRSLWTQKFGSVSQTQPVIRRKRRAKRAGLSTHCSLEVADSVVIPQNLNKFERKMGYKSVKNRNETSNKFTENCPRRFMKLRHQKRVDLSQQPFS